MSTLRPLSLSSLIPGQGPGEHPWDGATRGLERGFQNHGMEGRQLAEDWGLGAEPLDTAKLVTAAHVSQPNSRFTFKQRGDTFGAFAAVNRLAAEG